MRGEHRLIIGSAILSELEAVLVEVCDWSSDLARAACGELETLGEVVSPAEVPRVCRDPDDDEILAIASAGRASVLVTGDADLLTLANYGPVKIVTVADFEERGSSSSAPGA